MGVGSVDVYVWSMGDDLGQLLDQQTATTKKSRSIGYLLGQGPDFCLENVDVSTGARGSDTPNVGTHT